METLNIHLTFYWYDLDRAVQITILKNKLKRFNYITRHPTVPFLPPYMFRRYALLKNDVNPTSPCGIQILPISYFIRYNTKNVQFSVRLQAAHLLTYESFEVSNNNIQYWVQYRNAHALKSNYNYEFSFPNVGLMCLKDATSLIQINTGTKQSIKFQPHKDKKSYVFKYKNLGIGYHEYSVSQIGD
jgi:hypothetical protein